MIMSRMLLSILLYIICLFIIFSFKPAMMFDINGNFKHFGYDEADNSASLLNADIVFIVLALFCYFMIIAIELAVYS